MPTPALPVSQTPEPGWQLFLHRYADPLGRSMTGTATVTAIQAIELSDGVIPNGVGADVELAHGILQAQLRPGSYRIVARLATVDGQEVVYEEVITIQPLPETP